MALADQRSPPLRVRSPQSGSIAAAVVAAAHVFLRSARSLARLLVSTSRPLAHPKRLSSSVAGLQRSRARCKCASNADTRTCALARATSSRATSSRLYAKRLSTFCFLCSRIDVWSRLVVMCARRCTQFAIFLLLFPSVGGTRLRATRK